MLPYLFLQWGDCIPHYNLPCGEGQRARVVRCPAGIALEAECRRRAPKPVVLEQCHVPCTGMDNILYIWRYGLELGRVLKNSAE